MSGDNFFISLGSASDSDHFTVRTPPTQTLKLAPKAWYPINWSKVKTTADVVAILEAMNFRVEEGTAVYDKLRRYLVVPPSEDE